jgi:pantoate--beta-alanine ligase
MKIVTSASEIDGGCTFVPTMGALHAGHASLFKLAKAKSDFVVASIFVNPLQFDDAQDLANYPRTPDRDIEIAAESGVTHLWLPTEKEIYPSQVEKISAGDLGNIYEGANRSGHFDGVVTILTKLFGIIKPNHVFFGQKDYQQCLVAETLIKRNFPEIILNRCKIIREVDGLAMSSRNSRLSSEERELASKIYLTLKFIESKWLEDNWQNGLLEARNILNIHPFNLEYLEACQIETLMPINAFLKPVVILVAVNLGTTRLIDNLIIR